MIGTKPALPAQTTALFDAINSATPERLRTVLKKLAQEQADAHAAITAELLLERGRLKRAAPWEDKGIRPGKGLKASHDEADDDDNDDDDNENGDDDEGAEEDAGETEEDAGETEDSEYSDEGEGIMSRQRFEICGQCHEEYDVLLNGRQSCVWHAGETEVDEDGGFWDDWDEAGHGEIDTQFNREEYPEGFKWSCCDKFGDRTGCKISRHRPNRDRRIKRE